MRTILMVLCLSLGVAYSQENPAAQRAWKELEANSRPPQPPAEWQEKRPSEKEMADFRKSESVRLGKAADLAKDFYTKYPADPNAAQAKARERQLLDGAVRLGNLDAATRLAVV